MAGGERDSSTNLRAQLAQAQAITHIGSWQWTPATGAITWSDELYRIYGLEPGSVEITLDGFLGRLHPDDRDHVERTIRAVVLTGGRFEYRERVVRPDGSIRILDTMGDAHTDEQGVVTRLSGICRDVTDTVAREERARFYAEVFEHAEIGLSAWQLDASRQPAELRLVALNAALARMLDIPVVEGLGGNLSTLVPSLASDAALEAARGIASQGGVAKLAPFRRATATGTAVFAATMFELPDGKVGMSVEDTTRQVHAEALFAAERGALAMLASGAPLSDILATIVAAIEAQSVGGIASIVLLDETGTRLRHGAAPGLPDAFNRAIEGLPIGPRAGSCGTAMFRREPVVVTDIETDPLWEDYRELARAHGLRACWSYPILASDERVLGSFALYHRTARSPSQRGAEGLQRAAHITGMAIERRLLDDQLRALTARIEAAREDERTKIAHEVHDQLGQAVTALKLDIGWLQRRITDPTLAARLGDMSSSTDDVLQIVRRISSELRPGVLDALGLPAAIEWQAEEFQRRTGTRCSVTSAVTDLHLERDLSTAVFRIFQEALTNVARHARAEHVEVHMFLERGSLHLEVADDGVGVSDLGPPVATLGILGMRERARRLGGDCTVKRRNPRGTVVSVTVPLRFPAERASG